MKIAGLIFFLGALISYLAIWRSIAQLVKESRQAEPDTHLSRIWWLPAWDIHQINYPASPVRRQIILRFVWTAILMTLAMACIGYSLIHSAHPYQTRLSMGAHPVTMDA